MLIERGANINKAEENKELILFLIVNHMWFIKENVSRAPELEKTYKKYLEELKLLADLPQVDLEVYNAQGEIPLKYAKSLNLPEAYEILAKAMAKRKWIEKELKEKLIIEKNIPVELVEEILKYSKE